MLFLLAEDDAHLSRGVTRLLEVEGFSVVTTDNGSEVVPLFRKHQPDFCILDVMMPGMDGFEVCRQIRSDHPYVPIVMLTACGDEIDRVNGLETGADDYVTKPFSARELIARIRTILRRCEPSGRSVNDNFMMDDLEVCPASLRGQRAGQSIELTSRELSILQLLYKQQGLAVSRNEIFDHCWGRDYLPNSRALDQYIFSLRQKIEHDPAEPRIIRTVHGVGYRFEAHKKG